LEAIKDNGTMDERERWQVETKSVRDHVTGRLREAILSGELTIGQQLVENDLAALLGVSRAPIREALQQLSGEGLVDHIPRIGRFVHVPSPSEVQEVQEIRGMLEGLAARKLAEKVINEGSGKWIDTLAELISKGEQFLDADNMTEYFKTSRQFHEKLVSFTGSKTLETLHQFIMNRAALFRQLSGEIVRKQAITEHINVVESIRNGDGERAEMLTRQHALNGMLRIQNVLRERELS
jgi:DNA-binding GntR family transcriptional regulator